MIEIIKGDLLKSNCKYIAHQCNCITTNSAGTALAIFTKYPYSNIYQNRYAYKDMPGTVKISGNGKDERYIINMFAQWYPGKPKPPRDSVERRLIWFEDCLKDIEKISDLDSIGFPYKIGCNLGGGKWEDYFQKLKNFSERINARVIVYDKQNRQMGLM